MRADGKSFAPAAVLIVLIVFPLILSCSDNGMGIFDLLRSSPFEIVNWSPGGGCHGDLSALSVSLAFSHVPDRASVERHFSLSAGGERISGAFRWEDGKVTFLPANPLEKNRDYALSLAADAHDEDGVSLDKAFEGRFTTRTDNTRPALVSVSPKMNEVVNDLYTGVYLVFSRPVPLDSLRDYISFSPSINGSWHLEGEGTAALFSPAEPWSYGKQYEIKISSLFAGNNGMSMGSDFSSAFIIGSDLEKPRLNKAWCFTKMADNRELEKGIAGENVRWEKDDRLRLAFSEPVDTLSVKNCLDAEGAPSLRMETLPGLNEEVVFSFESPPAYESRFSFRLKTGVKDRFGNESDSEYVFKIFVNGPRSKPPALAGVRIPMAPGSASDQELRSYGIDSLFMDLPVNPPGPLEDPGDRYPYAVQTETWIECYFETAPGLTVDVYSLMRLFRIETSNNALNFSPRFIKEDFFSVADPEPGWENYQRLEIRGFLVNTVNSGVVTIRIDSGLLDSGGNKSEKAFCVSLLK
jgi:hypothetical protein